LSGKLGDKLEKFSIWLVVCLMSALSFGLPIINPEYLDFDFIPIIFDDFYMGNIEVEILSPRGKAQALSGHPFRGTIIPSFSVLVSHSKFSTIKDFEGIDTPATSFDESSKRFGSTILGDNNKKEIPPDASVGDEIYEDLAEESRGMDQPLESANEDEAEPMAERSVQAPAKPSGLRISE
jgi:hypothetical protein